MENEEILNKKDSTDRSIDVEWQIDSEWINLSSELSSVVTVNNKKEKKARLEVADFETEAPPTFHFITAPNDGRFLVVDNKALRLSQKKPTGYSYWVCSIPCCTARCVLDSDEKKIVRFCREHNHEAEINRQEYKKFINALKIGVKENPHVKPKVLYDIELEKARERWKENNLKNNTNEEEPSLPNFEAVRTAMYNSRNAVLSAVSFKAARDERSAADKDPVQHAGPSRSTRSRDARTNPKRKSAPSKTMLQSCSDLDELVSTRLDRS